ncbi:hypothetical protein SAMN05444352_102272 [Pseudomonas japonica]|uniref:Uncharacterized protein n=1 Tax=Pseudomonas japonica TaxID=256466 RepID=A0A239B3B1_9PSED|nr:hypothetical protein SAMN05444352_102272 [Pseudomonas japonica]
MLVGASLLAKDRNAVPTYTAILSRLAPSSA